MENDITAAINRRYLSGLSNEPKQILQPISGYTHEPLLTLEEACEPLHNIVPRLPAHIWVAKQNSKNPHDELTQDESAAIRLYTMEWDSGPDEPHSSLYAQLNRTLKQIDRTKLRPWFKFLKLFLTALAKLPSAPRQTVWRGVRKNHSEDYAPGEEVTWWGFSSCTTSLSVLESDQYLGNAGTRTLFSIETINGRTIRSHSHFTTEDEILLLPGTFFEVKSRLNPAQDLYLVHLQQKIPPHDLLDPPFEGAALYPPTEQQIVKNVTPSSEVKPSDKPDRRWYQKKRFYFRLSLAILLIIFIVLLATLLTTLKKAVAQLNPGLNVPGAYDQNLTIYPPASVAYAFYPFDQSVQDLYCRHDGQIIGNGTRYTEGYVGPAILLNQSTPTSIFIPNPFNISGTSFTIEAFVILFNNSMDDYVVQFLSNTSLSFQMGRLRFILNGRYEVSTIQEFPLQQWSHFAIVYTLSSSIRIFINGNPAGGSDYILDAGSNNSNITMSLGSGFEGVIDQLSITLEAKTSERILWDATVLAYYPLDGDQNSRLLDYGPSGRNASSAGTQSVAGPLGNGLSFVVSGAYYQANGFVVLNLVRRAFSVALWVRLQNDPGVFLTIANSASCLLVLGIRSSDNRTVAYLPNATNTNTSVNLIGSAMTSNRWTHIAFTWSQQNQAQLYQNGAFEGRNNQAIKLNNGQGEPMTVTLGRYRGSSNCSGADGIDMNKQFSGSMDEFYIFSRELGQDEIEKLNSTSRF